MPDFTISPIDDMEAVIFGSFKRARAVLGVESFGMQVIDLPPNAELYPEHDHAESGQEEVFVPIGGSGWMEIDGERVNLDQETLVRVGPEPKRKVHSGPEGLRMLVIGGCPGEPYKISAMTELSTTA